MICVVLRALPYVFQEIVSITHTDTDRQTDRRYRTILWAIR